MSSLLFHQKNKGCHKSLSVFIVASCILTLWAGIAWGTEYPGELSQWQGFTCHNFELDGRDCRVVVPAEPAADRPWLLYAAPPEEVSVLDRKLLNKGFHIAYMDVENLYGNTDAVACWNSFYGWVRDTLGLAEKPVIAGAEHAAILLYHWAAQNSNHVACIYAERPWLEWNSISDVETVEHVRLKVIAANKDNKSSLIKYAGIVGKSAIPIMHFYEERQYGKVPDKSIEQFYAAYRLAGKGKFESITKPSIRSGAAIDLTLAPILFILKHTDQLVGAPIEQPIAAMPEWRVADFSGRSGIFVIDDVLVIEEGNEMTGIVCTETPPLLNYEIVLDTLRLAGGDFFCGLTAPYKDTSFSLVIGGWGGTCVGISSLDWLDAYHNETAKFRSFDDLRWYRIRLRVTEETIQVWIDGKETVNVNVADRDVDIRWEMSPTVPLGIATWRTTGAIRNFSIRAINE
ncbi:MAG: hypothetical protein KAH38_00540 [Candidatus Hydrogenedentes bacterium]|nr:hypothetical protein [Candidatus Hydrogenedentota bacterium]